MNAAAGGILPTCPRPTRLPVLALEWRAGRQVDRPVRRRLDRTFVDGRDVPAAPPATAVTQLDHVPGPRGQQAAVDRDDGHDGTRRLGGSAGLDEEDPGEALHGPVNGAPRTEAHHAWSRGGRGPVRSFGPARSNAICTECRALPAAVRTATASASQVAGSSCAQLMRAMSIPASISSAMSAPSPDARPGMVTMRRTRSVGGTGPSASMVWRWSSSRLDVLVGAPAAGRGSEPRWRRTASIVASTCAFARPASRPLSSQLTLQLSQIVLAQRQVVHEVPTTRSVRSGMASSRTRHVSSRSKADDRNASNVATSSTSFAVDCARPPCAMLGRGRHRHGLELGEGQWHQPFPRVTIG